MAVRLNNNWNAQIPPITGDHTFQGGLYRDVFVVVTDPLHVTWYGTWVTTPTLAANAGASSTVSIKTEVQNNRSAAVNATLRTDIVDKDGKVVATVTSQQMIDAKKTVTFDQTTPAITSPSLWHPDHPTLYKALSYLSDGSGTADTFTTTFGFRWFSWTADKGFSLNGAHYWIQGGNVHQDHAGWGSGVADSALYRDVKMVKDAGMNFIRGSHYPKAPAFADACDQLGILFWSENCFWGGFGGGPGGWSYNGAYPEQLRRLRQVRRQRPREPHRDDPHSSQSPEHRRVEHGQRGLLQRRSCRQGDRAAQEVGGLDSPARPPAGGTARRDRRSAVEARRHGAWHAR